MDQGRNVQLGYQQPQPEQKKKHSNQSNDIFVKFN